MENVTDRRRNPFGLVYPCDPVDGSLPVTGYGDANADVHLIGDHPRAHGGSDSGIPFDGPESAALLEVLQAVGLVGPDESAPSTTPAPGSVPDRDGNGDGDGDTVAPTDTGSAADGTPAERTALPDDGSGPSYRPRNLFCSYLYPCPLPDGRDPTPAEYDRLEPSFDAELRAVAAHVLLPVGDRPLGHVLEAYTSKAHRLPADAAALHATEVPGGGFLVVPVRDPVDWSDEDRRRLTERLRAVLGRDYRRTADLGRFFPGDDAYLVR